MAYNYLKDLTRGELMEIVTHLKKTIGQYRHKLIVLEGNLRRLENLTIEMKSKTKSCRRLSQAPVPDVEELESK